MWFTWNGHRDLFAEMDAFRREMDALFDWNTREPRGVPGEMGWERSDDSYTLSFDVPGLKAEDVELTVQGGQLTLNAERKVEPPAAGMRARHRERRSFKLSRTLTLPEDADPNDLKADLRDGVLTVRMGTRPEVKARRIAIGAN